MLTFEECRCVTKEGRDWIAEFVVDLEEPGEEPFVVSYCPLAQSVSSKEL